MQATVNGIDLIKHFEGFRTDAYQCPAGIWTIGYGTTSKVVAGMRVTPHEAEILLKADIRKFSRTINHYVLDKGIPLNPNQFDALLSLVYNNGTHAIFTKRYDNGYPFGSALYNLLLDQKYFGAANRFPDFCKVNGRVHPVLVRRRQLERRLFLETIY